MLVETFLLPRFLILELVIFCHYFHFANTCHSLRVRRYILLSMKDVKSWT